MTQGTDGSPHKEEAAAAAVLELIVAVSENDVIGRGNALPWHLSGDLQRFKALTMGCAVLMGRATFQSIGKALPGRLNIVLTRRPGFAAPGCMVVPTLAAARHAAGAHARLMVIGGADVYRQCLAHAVRIHLTLVHASIEDGDTFFDGWRDPRWCETWREVHAADVRNDHAYSFVTLEPRGHGATNSGQAI